MENDFDPDWPHGHVVDNCPARIIYRDAKGDFPIVAIVLDAEGSERPISFTSSGKYLKSGNVRELDLRNAPAPKKRVTGWLNIYEASGYNQAVIYPTKERADSSSSIHRIACIHIDVEEGEGL